MTAEKCLGDWTNFVTTLARELSAKGIDIKPYEIDHLCYRVANLDRYETKKTELAQLGYLLSEAQVNGRPIATYKLKKPLKWSHGKYISLVELPAPKPGKNYSEGLEHFEVEVAQPLKSFMALHHTIVFETHNIDNPINPDISLQLASGTVKFHPESLEEVIRKESLL